MAVVILGAVMSFLDSTIVNVALRTLSVDLHAPIVTIQWVVTAYLLALAAVVPATGWAAKRFGARRLFLISVALFSASSLLCGLAGSPGELIGLRALQGAAGGVMGPVGQMILVTKAGPRNMARVMSAVGVPIILAPIVGPTLGGFLIVDASWRWIFFVNVPVGLATVILGTRLLPPDGGQRAGRAGRLDAAGLTLVAAAAAGVTYGLAQMGATGHLAAPGTLIPLSAGVALFAAFAWWELRARQPLLDVRLYRNTVLRAASVTTFCYGAAIFGGMILMPLYYQIVRHDDALVTGLLLAPQGVGAAIAMWLSGRATERFGAGLTALAGSAISMLGTLPLVLIGPGTSYVAINAAICVRGFGIGMSAMPAMTAAFRVLDPAQVKDATPQLSVVQRIGGSVGTAVFAVVLQQGLSRAGEAPGAQAAAFGTAFWWVLAVTAAAALPTIMLVAAERRARRSPA
jgi:EmrB/QacA subfamily drug resistance transporter